MESRIELNDFYIAYRKLKSMVYYDSGGLDMKLKIAEFEHSLSEDTDPDESFRSRFLNKIRPLHRALNSRNNVLKNETVSDLLDQVSYKITPKSFSDSSSPNNRHESKSVKFFTNDIGNDICRVDSYNLMIDVPVEVHILSVLWLMKVAVALEKEIPANNYAYRLSLRDNDDEHLGCPDGLLLFRPYFSGYQKWLDNGLETTARTLDHGYDCALVSLDIRRFFYSVRMNVLDVFRDEVRANPDILSLTKILQEVHERHAASICGITPVELTVNDFGKGNVMLLLGLPTSGWLANYHLADFDRKVWDNLNPEYYGRYVDDMIFVIRCSNLPGDDIDDRIDNFLNKYFIDSGLIQKNENHDGFVIHIGNNQFEIQDNKIIIEYFRHDCSRAALNKFMKNVNRNRSEFRYLPFDSLVDVEFDDEAVSLEYSDSVNKLRSVDGISNSRFGASTYLAHKIFIALSDTDPDESESRERRRTSRQILSFFRGKTALEMNSLWEKVITYFLLTHDFRNLRKFCDQIGTAIRNLQSSQETGSILAKHPEDFHTSFEDEVDMISTLFHQLELSLAMAAALCPDLVKDNLRSIDSNLSGGFFTIEDIHKHAKLIRKSYLFRQNYVKLPGICFTEYDTLSNDLTQFPTTHLDKLKIDPSKGEVSPIFLHFHHCNLLEVLASVGNDNPNPEEILNNAYDGFVRFNYKWRDLEPKNKPFYIKHDPDTTPNICRVEVFDDSDMTDKSENWPNKLIGLVNMRVNPNDCEDALRNRFVLGKRHRDTLFELLNYANKHHVELTVFPEVSLPLQLMPLLVSQSSRNNLAIIAGINYVVDNGTAYNYTMTMLPVKTRYYNTCLILPRLKNYPAPSEQDLVSAFHLRTPQINPRYDLIHWRGVYFSVYNCFEMSNLSDRALFKSQVDFIVATEFNKDINYYANVVESWVRDLHCFIIQVNTSEYGDSRLSQPKSSAMINSMQVSGGKRPVMLIDTLDINGIRDFQEHATSWQINPNGGKGIYKPTPANFDYTNTIRRRKNLPIIHK